MFGEPLNLASVLTQCLGPVNQGSRVQISSGISQDPFYKVGEVFSFNILSSFRAGVFRIPLLLVISNCL